jgi:hypothetical protein
MSDDRKADKFDISVRYNDHVARFVPVDGDDASVRAAVRQAILNMLRNLDAGKGPSPLEDSSWPLKLKP